MKAEELEAGVRKALHALAKELGGNVTVWDNEARAQLVLRQGVRCGVGFPALVAALGAMTRRFREARYTGKRLDREIGPFHFRAALLDELRAETSPTAEHRA